MKKAEYSKKTKRILEYFKTTIPLSITKEEAIDSLIRLLNALPEENTVNFFLALDYAIKALESGKSGAERILSDDCKTCKYGYTVKCESGEEYVCCHMKKCQQEKKKEGAV